MKDLLAKVGFFNEKNEEVDVKNDGKNRLPDIRQTLYKRQNDSGHKKHKHVSRQPKL
ncbi:hypothetical protein [Parapedobacter sp. 10938]|uniref:hypothetical protein n=1 Tax=Parapedobacter flavus TaxID=3110225 RepID=UPI002DB70150|nr:hypothetical protein [Parapedobacter sp. 10938]MEC3881181.1 hypothetical protein [Parapedobacter sp. 10938]